MSGDEGRSESTYDGPAPYRTAAVLAEHAMSLPVGYAWCVSGCNSFSGPFDPPRTYRCGRPACQGVPTDDASSQTPSCGPALKQELLIRAETLRQAARFAELMSVAPGISAKDVARGLRESADKATRRAESAA